MENNNQNPTPPIGSPLQGPTPPVQPAVPPAQPATPAPSASASQTPPAQPKKSNKILLMVFGILILVLLGGVGVYVLGSGVLNPPPPATVKATPTPTEVPASPTPEELKTEEDLNNTLNELDGEEPETIQKELDQNSKDSSEFSN